VTIERPRTKTPKFRIIGKQTSRELDDEDIESHPPMHQILLRALPDTPVFQRELVEFPLLGVVQLALRYSYKSKFFFLEVFINFTSGLSLRSNFFLQTSLCLSSHVGMQEPIVKKKIRLLRGTSLN
jgi:hypothetical protein